MTRDELAEMIYPLLRNEYNTDVIMSWVDEYALAEYNTGVDAGIDQQQEAQMYDEMNRQD